ncbi:MAG: DUF3090 family protein [Actinomycetota bacterium]
MEYTFERIERLVIGTIGMPGEREFFLQVVSEKRTFSFAIEKGQAIALVDRLRELMRELRRRDSARFQGLLESVAIDDLPLETPVESEFALGEMSLMWVDDSDRIVFEADGIEEEKSLTVSITLGEATEFIRRSERVISAGRAPCPFCGLPINLDGHLCPRANGYRR